MSTDERAAREWWCHECCEFIDLDHRCETDSVPDFIPSAAQEAIRARQREEDAADHIELLVEVWCQWGQYREPDGTVRWSNMCLSTLEDVESELRSCGLLHKSGEPDDKAIALAIRATGNTEEEA